MKKRILIITGGTLKQSFLEGFLRKETYDYLICADRGLVLADALQLKVDCIVGDFDSVEEKTINKYKKLASNGSIKIREFIPEKDFTDTHIAIETAMEEEPDEIVLLGATGSRLDHTLGNIHLLIHPLQKHINATIVDEHNKIYLIDKETEIKKEDMYGAYISLIPWTKKVKEVTLKGFRYPLEKRTLVLGESIGISNEIKEEKAYISFTEGVLIVMETRD